jgi:hypothetical protein
MVAVMKAFNFIKTFLAVIVVSGLALSPLSVLAEDSSAGTAPPLAYGVPQILKLQQAKVTDDVIIAYIHNSGSSYGLDADQIIYLRQQGISDKVLTTMLAQPRPAPAPTAPANSYVTPTPVAYAQPTPAPAYVPSSTYYVIPNNQIYYSSGSFSYYPYYYPYVTYSWCGGYHNNCYYRGGYCGGGYYNGYHGSYCYGNGYHGGTYCYAGGGGNHGAVAYASRGISFHGGGSFGGGSHGGGMMHR